jgi:N-acetylglucosamine kinase-like BadF-type ATPase
VTLLVGVDGGNTKTVALVARADGTIVGSGRAGCCDHYGQTTPEEAYAEVAKAVEAALAEAGATTAEISGAVFSLAGADWDEDIEVYRHEIGRRLGTGFRLSVVNDAIGALRAGTDDGVGTVVACGTGTAIGARGNDGTLWHVSMWGLPSFRYSPSRAAIEAAVRAELGISAPSVLQQRVPEMLGYPSVEALLKAMSLPGADRPALGGAAVALLDAAAQGDPAALRALREVASQIAELVRVGARLTGLRDASPVVLAGGLFRHPSLALVRALERELPESAVVEARFEPAAGALLMAFDEAGIVPDLERLTGSLPPAGLFASAGA